MVSSFLLLAAPLSLFPATWALPKNVSLGPGEGVEVQCQGVTVTQTLWLPAPSASSTEGAESSASTATSGTAPVDPPPTASSTLSSAPSSSSQTAGTATSSAAVPGNTTTGGPPSGYRNALYFTNWGIYGADMQPQRIPADKVTHVLYAFADIAPDGEVKSSDSWADLEKRYPTDSWNDQGRNAYGCVKQMYLLKKKHRHVKTLLSIGGWTYSPKFAPVAATAAGRRRFCDSAVTLMKDWGFDGLDIDWEYPADAQQARDYVLLLQTCRAALDAYAAAQHAAGNGTTTTTITPATSGYRFLLTIAAPAGPQNYNTLDLAAMDPLLDAWHIMAYDYAGSWDATTGHQANIFPSASNPAATKFSTDRAVRDYTARGVAARKLVLGLPLYGRAFEATAGPGAAYAGVGGGSAQAGIWLYRDLPRPGAREVWDAEAGASYSYDAARRAMVSYDNLASARRKVQYLLEKGLGGAVFWEASGDKAGAGSLVAAVKEGMGELEQSRNCLSYPASVYDNIRAGMPGA